VKYAKDKARRKVRTYAIIKFNQWLLINCELNQIRIKLKNIAAMAPYTPPIRNSRLRLLLFNVSITYDTAKTIGIPPIAPAILGPENFAIIKIIAVIMPDAILLMIISILFIISKNRLKLQTGSW